MAIAQPRHEVVNYSHSRPAHPRVTPTQHPPSLRAALALLAQLCISRAACDELARLDGYRRLFRLATRRDDALSLEVLRTAQALLSPAASASVGDSESPVALADGAAPPGSLASDCGGRWGVASRMSESLRSLGLPSTLLTRLPAWRPTDASAAATAASAFTAAPEGQGAGSGFGVAAESGGAALESGAVLDGTRVAELRASMPMRMDSTSGDPPSVHHAGAPMRSEGSAMAAPTAPTAAAAAAAAAASATVADRLTPSWPPTSSQLDGAQAYFSALGGGGGEPAAPLVEITEGAARKSRAHEARTPHVQSHMQSQGALRALIGLLREGRCDAVLLEAMRTIRALVCRNALNQIAFTALGGYDAIALALDAVPVASSPAAAATAAADHAIGETTAGSAAANSGGGVHCGHGRHRLFMRLPTPFEPARSMLISGVYAVMYEIVVDDDTEEHAAIANADAASAVVGYVASLRERGARMGAIQCLRELLVRDPTNVVFLAQLDVDGGRRRLLDHLVAALSLCDEPVPPHVPPSLTPHGDGTLWAELASVLLLATFLLSNAISDGRCSYVPRRMLQLAALDDALPLSLIAGTYPAVHLDSIRQTSAPPRWRLLHALSELATDLAARGCLKQPQWHAFAHQLSIECLTALTAATQAFTAAAAQCGDGRSSMASGGVQMCGWVLQMLGTLATAAPALVQPIERANGMRILSDLAVASAAVPAPDPAQHRLCPEPWEAALWLVGELTALGARSGCATSGAQELALLLRRCSPDALSTLEWPPTRDAGEGWVLAPPEPLWRALAEMPAPSDGSCDTPVPSRARAAVLNTIAQLIEITRAHARRGLLALKRQLLDAGVLPLVMLPLLRAPHDWTTVTAGALLPADLASIAASQRAGGGCSSSIHPVAATAPTTAIGIGGGGADDDSSDDNGDDDPLLAAPPPHGLHGPTRCVPPPPPLLPPPPPPTYSPIVVAALRALTELIAADADAKSSVFQLLGSTGLLGMLHAASFATAAAAHTGGAAVAPPPQPPSSGLGGTTAGAPPPPSPPASLSPPHLTREAMHLGFEICTAPSFRRVLRLASATPLSDVASSQLRSLMHRVRECWPAFPHPPAPTATIVLPTPRRPVSSSVAPRSTSPSSAAASPLLHSPPGTATVISPISPLSPSVTHATKCARTEVVGASERAAKSAAAADDSAVRDCAAGDGAAGSALGDRAIAAPDALPEQVCVASPLMPAVLPSAPSPLLGTPHGSSHHASVDSLNRLEPLLGSPSALPPTVGMPVGFPNLVAPLGQHDHRLLEDLLPELIPELRSPMRSRGSTATASPRTASALGGVAGMAPVGLNGSLAHLSLQLPHLVGLHIRNRESAAFLVTMITEGRGFAQLESAALLLLMLESNPLNKRHLASCHSMLPLLKLLSRCVDDGVNNLRIHLLRTAAALGEYTLSGSEAMLLFRLAATPELLLPEQTPSVAGVEPGALHASEETPDALTCATSVAVSTVDGSEQERHEVDLAGHEQLTAQRESLREELQMQMLFVIGCIAERSAPRHFFSFDGGERLDTGPLTHLPASKVGYTLSFWLRVSTQPQDEPEVSVLHLYSAAGHAVVQIALRVRDPEQSNTRPTRVLLVRTSHNTMSSSAIGCSRMHSDGIQPEPTCAYAFDGWGFGDGGEWHHVALSHSRVAGAQLCVDGSLVETTGALAYPEISAPRNSRKSSLAPPVSTTTRFCGQLAAIVVMEGTWDMRTAARVYHRGALHTDSERSLRALGVEGRILVHRSAYTPPARSRRRRVVRTTSSLHRSASSRWGRERTCADTSSAPAAVHHRCPGALEFRHGERPPTMSPSADEVSMACLAAGAGAAASGSDEDRSDGEDDGAASRRAAAGDVCAEKHHTEFMVDQLGCVGGALLCLPFVQLGAAQRTASLRILLAMLHADDAGCREYCEMQHGFALLLHLLLAPLATDSLALTLRAPSGAGAWADSPDGSPSTETLELLLETVDRGLRASAPGACLALPPPPAALYHPTDRMMDQASVESIGDRDRSPGTGGHGEVGGTAGGAADAAKSKGCGGGVEALVVSSVSVNISEAGGKGGAKTKWLPVMLSSHALQLVVDLLPACTPDALRRTLEALGERLSPASAIDAADAARLWRHIGGVPLMLALSLLPAVSGTPAEGLASELAGAPTPAATDDALDLLLGARRGLLGHIAASLTADDAECLLDFLVMTPAYVLAALNERHSDGSYAMPSLSGIERAQARVALTLCELCEGSGRDALPSAVSDHLRASGPSGVFPIISLLGAPEESIRICALRALGALLQSPSPAGARRAERADAFSAAFYRMHGWELAARALRLQPASAQVCRALLELATGGEQLLRPLGRGGRREERDGASSGGSAGSATGAAVFGSGEATLSELQHPGALQLLLEALAGCADLGLQIRFLCEMENLFEMRPRSMEAVLDSEWVRWVGSLLLTARSKQTADEYSALAEHAVGLVSRVLLHDLTYTPRGGCRLTKLHELSEVEVFQQQVVAALLDHFEQRPILPMPEATHILTNFCILFELVDELADGAHRLPLRAARLVNQIASHNSSTVRRLIKSNGLFDMRDMMLLDSLHKLPSLEDTHASELIAQVQHPLLAEPSARLLLLLLLLTPAADHALRTLAGELLLQEGAAERETRAQRHGLSKAIDDAEIVGRLLSTASEMSDPVGATPEQVQSSVVNFLAWHDGADGPSLQRREAVCARLNRALQSSGSAARRAAEKAAAKRAKRAKACAERLSKSSSALVKAVADAAERQGHRVERGGRFAARRVAAVVELRRARLVHGERGWALRSRWVIEQLMPAAGAMALATAHQTARMLHAVEEEGGGSIAGESASHQSGGSETRSEEGKSDHSREGTEPEDEAEPRRRRKRILRVPFSGERWTPSNNGEGPLEASREGSFSVRRRLSLMLRRKASTTAPHAETGIWADESGDDGYASLTLDEMHAAGWLAAVAAANAADEFVTLRAGGAERAEPLGASAMQDELDELTGLVSRLDERRLLAEYGRARRYHTTARSASSTSDERGADSSTSSNFGTSETEEASRTLESSA